MASNSIEPAEMAETTLDHVYRTLAHEQRRIVVDVLEDRSSIPIEELAGAVVTRGGGGSREQVEMALVHTHLPLLATTGAVEYDGDRVRKCQQSFDVLVELSYTAT